MPLDPAGPSRVRIAIMQDLQIAQEGISGGVAGRSAPRGTGASEQRGGRGRRKLIVHQRLADLAPAAARVPA